MAEMDAEAMTPQRIQLRRVKGYRMPPDAVNVARPTKWGNPFKVGTPGYPWGDPIEYQHPMTRQEAVDEYENWLAGLHHDKPTFDVSELRGKDLACWCALTDSNGRTVPCHAAVLLEISNQ